MGWVHERKVIVIRIVLEEWVVLGLMILGRKNRRMWDVRYMLKLLVSLDGGRVTSNPMP